MLVLVIKCRKAREKRIALARQEGEKFKYFRNSIMTFKVISAQSQNGVHVVQIGNSFYDVIPITSPSASITRCHHHSQCQRAYHMRSSDSSSSLNANAHSNPTFILDEGVFPSGKSLNELTGRLF